METVKTPFVFLDRSFQNITRIISGRMATVLNIRKSAQRAAILTLCTLGWWSLFIDTWRLNLLHISGASLIALTCLLNIYDMYYADLRAEAAGEQVSSADHREQRHATLWKLWCWPFPLALSAFASTSVTLMAVFFCWGNLSSIYLAEIPVTAQTPTAVTAKEYVRYDK